MKNIQKRALIIIGIPIILFITIIQTGCPRSDILGMFLTDGFPPYIVSVSPENETKGVALDATLEISFSESMERSSVELATSLTPGEPALAFTWDADNKSVRIRPAESFTEDSQQVYYYQATLYTLLITTEATDINLIHLEEDFSTTFTTMTIPRIAAGNNYTLCLNIEGEIFGCGNNLSGQLGNGSYENPTGFVSPLTITETKKIAAGNGGYHTLACKADGSVYAWGKNDNYQLGMGDSEDRNTPQPVSDINTVLGHVTWIAGGNTHSLACNQAGDVLSWGSNLRNQLGIDNGTAGYKENPVKITLFPGNAVKVDCGYSFSGALTSDNSLYLWGSNWRGQLGIETDGGSSTESYYTPQERSELGEVLDFSCGNVHTLAVVEEGGKTVIYSWGDNQLKQLGRPGEGDFAWSPGKVQGISDNLTIIKVAGGRNCSFALTADGDLYAWGSTDYYKLGISGIDPLSVTSVETPSIVLTDVIDIAAGGDHTVAIKSDGSVWTWGKNDQFQLGRTTTFEYNTTLVGEKPEQVPGIDLIDN